MAAALGPQVTVSRDASMDDQQRQFLRNLLHQVLNSSILSVIWRLPTPVLVGLIGVTIFAIFYFRLF
jgi:hypothetical protein